MSLLGWLNHVSPNESEEHGLAQVRDIEETIEVIALIRVGEGYGSFHEREDWSCSLNNPEIQRKIAMQTIALPRIFSAGRQSEATIKELEDFYRKNLRAWDQSSWLKGSLAVIFDEKGECTLNGKKLVYNSLIGITVKEEG